MTPAPRRPRILAIRLSALGDVANLLPVLAGLRRAHPGAWIACVVEDRARQLVEASAEVDEVFVFPRRRWVHDLSRPHRWPRLAVEFLRYLAALRRRPFDLSLDFQGNLKGAVHALVARVGVRFGYAAGHCYERVHALAHRRVRPASRRLHRVEKYRALARAALGDFEPAQPRLAAGREIADRVNRFLHDAGISRGAYVLVHPGTSHFGRRKRWPPSNFAELVRRVRRDLGVPCVVTWGPGERELANEVAAGGGVPAPETSVGELAELARGARLFIGCDSGPAHVAAAVGTPCVALFGPKDPAVYGPFPPERHRVVAKANGSMEAIAVEDAFDAIRSALA